MVERRWIPAQPLQLHPSAQVQVPVCLQLQAHSFFSPLEQRPVEQQAVDRPMASTAIAMAMYFICVLLG